MSINFKTVWYGLKIKAKSVLTSSTKGELEVDSASGKMYYHDGFQSSPIVTEIGTVNLVNKTIDADLNTITNIEDADIKSGANIDALKIGSGAVSNTEFNQIQYLQSDAVGIIDTQTLLNKTISADNNTISDIIDSNIKVGANISLSKLEIIPATQKALVSDGAGFITTSSTSTTDWDMSQVSHLIFKIN